MESPKRSNTIQQEPDNLSEVDQKTERERPRATAQGVAGRMAEVAGLRFDYTNSFAEAIPADRGGITLDSWSPPQKVPFFFGFRQIPRLGESGGQREKLKEVHSCIVHWIEEGDHPGNWLSVLSQLTQKEAVANLLEVWSDLDYKNLTVGVQEVFQSYLSCEDTLEHPAGAQAAILDLLASKEGKNRGVTNLFCLACYSRRLYPIARALSISFNSISRSPVTAFAVELPQGQHGVFQTLTKSMANTSATIVTPREWERDIIIPRGAKPLIASTDEESFTLGDLMDAAAEGTAHGLTQYATPNNTLILGSQAAGADSYSMNAGRFLAWMLLTARIVRELTRLNSSRNPLRKSLQRAVRKAPTNVQGRHSVQLPDGTTFSWKGAFGENGISAEEMPQVIAKAIEVKLRALREQEDGQHPYTSQFQIESERLDVYTDLAAKREHLKNIIVIAIGGASNSTRAMICPLVDSGLSANHTMASARPQIHFLDTNDPEVIAQTLDNMGGDILNTEVVIISNTGDTYETNANEKVVVSAIREELIAPGFSESEVEDEIKERIVVITGQGKGTLYEDTTDANYRGSKCIPLLEYPKTDGRRAIVSVGLYLAARVGLDIRAYIESQRRYIEKANLNDEQIQHLQKLQLELTSSMSAETGSTEAEFLRRTRLLDEALEILGNDPGLLHGVMESHINQKHDRHISQIIFFSSVYSGFLDWHAHQLNNESLGKPDIKRIALSWLATEAISQLPALSRSPSGRGQSVFTLVLTKDCAPTVGGTEAVVRRAHFSRPSAKGVTTKILFEIVRESLRSHDQPFFVLESGELSEKSHAAHIMFWLNSVIANAASFSGAQGTLVTSYGEDAVSKSRELTALAVNSKRNRSSQSGISDAIENFEIKPEDSELIHWHQVFAQMGPKLEYTIKEDPDYFRRPNAQAQKLVEDITAALTEGAEDGSLCAAIVLDPLTKRPIFVGDAAIPTGESQVLKRRTHIRAAKEHGKYIALAIPADNLENVHLTGGAVGSIMAIFDAEEGVDLESQRLGYDNLRMAYWYLHGAGSNPVVTIFSRRGETKWAYAYDYILAPNMTLIPKPLVGKDTHQIRMQDSKPGTVFFIEGAKSQFAPTFFQWLREARKKKIKLRNLKGLVANYYGVRDGGLMGIYLTAPEAVLSAALFKAGIRGDVLIVDDNGHVHPAEDLGISLGQLKQAAQLAKPPQRYIYAGDPLRVNDLRECFAQAAREGRANENLPLSGTKPSPSLKDVPLAEQPRTPLKEFLSQHRDTVPEEAEELVLITLGAANKFADEYNKVDVGEGTGTRNVSHEEQERGDQRANEMFKDAYLNFPHLIHKIVSEEEKRTLVLEREEELIAREINSRPKAARDLSARGLLESVFRLGRTRQSKRDRYNIGIDPLDGASNVKTGLPSGTFVALFGHAEERSLSISLVQGSRTLILAIKGLGTYLFRWDGKHSEDYLLLDKLQRPIKPSEGALKIASIGGSEAGYVGKTGKEPFSNPRVIQLIDRWVDEDFDIGHNNQGLVNDLVQICLGTAWGLYAEAVFVYGEQEETQANPSNNDYGGKMRLASEIASTALAIEEMGLSVAIGPYQSIHDVTIDLDDPELAKVTYPYSFGAEASVKRFVETQLPHYARRGLRDVAKEGLDEE